jgi:outer membrane phospholipase A
MANKKEKCKKQQVNKKYKTQTQKKTLKPYYLPTYENFNVQMLLHTLTKRIHRNSRKHVKCIDVILFYKIMCGGLMAKTLVWN